MTACSVGAFVGIGVYKNNEVFYDRYLMPMVQMCSPELCHRSAVLGFKYNLFPRQKETDSDRLVWIIYYRLSNFNSNEQKIKRF